MSQDEHELLQTPYSAPARLAMRIAPIALLLLAGCTAVDNETLALLPPPQARECKVWSTNHAIVFDLRIHSLETCPFLTYLPARSTLHGQEWAEWAWNFYGAKHMEEDNCTCEADLFGLAGR